MTPNLHHLTGCAPAPLARYLKALGILRIVAEQKDPAARGWWQDEHFCLTTKLSSAELEGFFLEDYAPTPMFNPWGARSGFYPGSSERTARLALEKIERSSLARLAPFRSAIEVVRSAVTEAGGKKPETDQAEAKLLDTLRREIRGGGEEWLSAVLAVVGDDCRKPALIGTGGNEGSGSYVSAYLNAVVACTIDRSQERALGFFCSSGPVPNYSWDGSFGQFLPEGEASAWDFLLMLEGATLFRSTVSLRSRQGQPGSKRFLSSPFYFEPHAVGSGAMAPIDEFSLQKGRPNPGRGEQWFPLWVRPTRFNEIGAILAEGRCSTAGVQASRSLDAVRAIGQLGVARGIDAFCRYGYLQRNNLSTHFAVPLARVAVRERPYALLVEDIAPWLRGLKRIAREKNTPARFAQAERRLADAVFALLSHDDSHHRWQSVLVSAAAVESIQGSGTGFKPGPIPPLAPEWVTAADDGSVEWRLACALGSASASYDRHRPRDSVRHHWLPLRQDGRQFVEKDNRLTRSARVVIGGRDAIADCGALVERRLLEAAQRGQRSLPLVAARGCEAALSDLAELIAGRVDLARVSALARALMAVRWDRWQIGRRERVHAALWPDEAWTALRLSCLPWPIDKNHTIFPDEAMVRRLMAGDGVSAVDIALRRLRTAGIRSPIRAAVADPATARLWAAALAFPISPRSTRVLAERFMPSNQKENR